MEVTSWILFLLFLLNILGWGLYFIALIEKKGAKKFIKEFVDQESVDNILEQSALLFDQRCKDEIEFQRSRDPEKLEIQYRDAAERVNFAKEEFWSKWKLAKVMGFFVRNSYKDYLPVPAADDEPKSAA